MIKNGVPGLNRRLDRPSEQDVNSEEVGPVSVAEVNRAVAGLRGMGFAQRLMIMVVLQDGAATPAMLADALRPGPERRRPSTEDGDSDARRRHR